MYYNSYGEKIYYVNRAAGGRLLNVYMAGETLPNPGYRIIHNTTNSHRWDHYVFEYVVDGIGYIEDDDGTHTVRAGDFYFLNRLKRHIYYSDTAQPFHKLFIVFFGELADRLISLYGLSSGLLIRHIDIGASLFEICSLLDRGEGQVTDEAFDRVSIILHQIIQRVSAGSNYLGGGDGSRSRDEQIRMYLDSNLYSRISLEDVSKYFFLSQTHIINLFKKQYGMTPMKYAAKKRIETAGYLLRTTELSVKEISALLHYCDSKVFTKAFSAQMKKPPTEYRREYQKGGRSG